MHRNSRATSKCSGRPWHRSISRRVGFAAAVGGGAACGRNPRRGAALGASAHVHHRAQGRRGRGAGVAGVSARVGRGRHRGRSRRLGDLPWAGTTRGLSYSRSATAWPGGAPLPARPRTGPHRRAAGERRSGGARGRQDERVGGRAQDCLHRRALQPLDQQPRLCPERHHRPQLLQPHRALRHAHGYHDLRGARAGPLAGAVRHPGD